MNRADLHQIANDRVLDAAALLNANRWSAAYYLAGYAVECGLKACIAKLTGLHDFPDKDFVNQSYTHKIEKLIVLSGLEVQLRTDATADLLLARNWDVVVNWDEQARYQQWAEPQARQLYEAVTDATNGVLPWIRVRW